MYCYIKYIKYWTQLSLYYSSPESLIFNGPEAYEEYMNSSFDK